MLDLGFGRAPQPQAISGTDPQRLRHPNRRVAIGFFVREQGQTRASSTFATLAVEDAELATDKLAYLRDVKLWMSLPLSDITPDAKNNWLNQSNSDFATV